MACSVVITRTEHALDQTSVFCCFDSDRVRRTLYFEDWPLCNKPLNRNLFNKMDWIGQNKNYIYNIFCFCMYAWSNFSSALSIIHLFEKKKKKKRTLSISLDQKSNLTSCFQIFSPIFSQSYIHILIYYDYLTIFGQLLLI